MEHILVDFVKAMCQIRLQIMFTDYGTHCVTFKQMGQMFLLETVSPPPVLIHDLQAEAHHRDGSRWESHTGDHVVHTFNYDIYI